MTSEQTSQNDTCRRLMVATVRKRKVDTVVLEDELPALAPGEIRMRVDKVGLSANNNFYAQMGEAPFLKFFAVYPLEGHPDLANVPAWGVGTIVASNNPELLVGERYRGFLHMANFVQMKARRTPEGLTAYGGKRDQLNKAYNAFLRVHEASPFHVEGPASDLAMVAAPGVVSAFLLCELMRMKRFYGADSVVLTSASSKLSLATAFLLREERAQGTLRKIIGYSSRTNAAFVRGTGLFDEVLCYEDELSDTGLRPILIDVAGDATIYRRLKQRLVKAFAVGGTHTNAKASTFTAFGPSGLLKLVASMVGPRPARNWVEEHMEPRLEMFFAPTVLTQLVERWGRAELDRRSDAALAAFVDAALKSHWIQVVRSETGDAIRAQYERIVRGTVPPSEAVVLSLAQA